MNSALNVREAQRWFLSIAPSLTETWIVPAQCSSRESKFVVDSYVKSWTNRIAVLASVAHAVSGALSKSAGVIQMVSTRVITPVDVGPHREASTAPAFASLPSRHDRKARRIRISQVSNSSVLPKC